MNLDQLIEHIKDIVDVREHYGDEVLKKALLKAHYDDVVGVFWYNILNKELDYINGKTNHNQFFRYDEYRSKNGMVRGRVVRDENKIFILIYTGDFEQHRVSGDIINNIYTQISKKIPEPIVYIIDELGRDLIEENAKQ